MRDVICVNLYYSKSWLNPQKKVNSVPSPLLLPLHNHDNKLFLPAAITGKIMLGENNATSASLHKNCIWLNSRLLNLSIQRKKDLSFLFGTYYFAKERYSQCSGRLIPFMPSKVTWSFLAKEIQENSTLSTKNVFITFKVSFKSVNRSGNKQFTPSCGSSSLETNPIFCHVWKRSYHKLTVFYNGTIFLLKEEKKTFTKRNLRRIMLFLCLGNTFTSLHTQLAKAWAGIKSCVPKVLFLLRWLLLAGITKRCPRTRHTWNELRSTI